MLKPARKPIQQTVILCLCTLLVSFPKHGGFILGFISIFLMPSLVKSLYLIFFKNIERRQRAIQTLLWAITCSVVIIHHLYLYKTTQSFAKSLSTAVTQYHEKTGFYPDSAESLGFNMQALKKYRLHYSYENETPFLFYPATWIAFDAYSFNFKTNKWEFQGS
ncbi:MAG: hypothetical protein V4660_06365 [Pseudomonadota bacterium]